MIEGGIPARVREPAVAGRFYPRAPAELRRAVEALVAASGDGVVPGARAILSPHAGYPCSGALAARAVTALRPAPSAAPRAPGTVFLLGPAHFLAVRGVALTTADAFETPLGAVEVDRAARDTLLAQGAPYCVADHPHAPEHSLEVQLPFLQVVLPGWRVVPMLTGDSLDVEAVAADLATLLDDGPSTAVVASSDLSHYYPYAVARQMDESALDAVVRGRAAQVATCEACGREGLLVVMAVARRLGWAPRLLGYASSGDTCGPKSEVVGYGCVAWYETVGRPSMG
jgi:hypothetical protein